MLYTKRTLERKQGKKWVTEDISENGEYINIMLVDELTAKYLFKTNLRIKYQYGKITVNYTNDFRAVYE